MSVFDQVKKFPQSNIYKNHSVLGGCAHFTLFSIQSFIGVVSGLGLLGLAYAIIGSTMWPLVGFLVPDKVTGMTYGLIASFIRNLFFSCQKF